MSVNKPGRRAAISRDRARRQADCLHLAAGDQTLLAWGQYEMRADKTPDQSGDRDVVDAPALVVSESHHVHDVEISGSLLGQPPPLQRGQ